jgi:hypothetical protein
MKLLLTAKQADMILNQIPKGSSINASSKDLNKILDAVKKHKKGK